MVARGVRVIEKPTYDPENEEMVEGKVLAQFEIGYQGWVEFIKFGQNKIILKGKVEQDGKVLKKSQTIPIGDNVLETISDSTSVPEDYRAPQRQNQRPQGRVF